MIAESAVAIVTNWRGERIFPLDLDSYEGGEIPLLAANKKVHAEILKLLK